MGIQVEPPVIAVAVVEVAFHHHREAPQVLQGARAEVVAARVHYRASAASAMPVAALA